jgi:hypothetical protein
MQRPTTPIPPTDEWVRMPQPKGRLCGLSRTTLLELARLRHIRVALVKVDPKASRAIRLIHMPSLNGYLFELTKSEKLV